MVSEETQRLGQSSQEKKNGSEEKKRGASIFGESEEKKQGPTRSQAVSSEDRQASSEGEGKNKNSSRPLKEAGQVSSEEKEAKMRLDEEGKEYIQKELDPLKKKLEVVDKVAQDAETTQDTLGTLTQAVEAIKEKVSEKPSSEARTKEAPVDIKGIIRQVATQVKESLKEEEETKRRLEEQEKAKLRERERLEELRKYCLDNPQAKECKSLPELVGKIVDERLEKKPAGEKASFGLSLPKKFEELTPEEQASLKADIDKKVPHPVLLGIMEECAKSDDPKRCNLVKAVSRAFPGEMTKELAEEAKKTVTVSVCKDDECKPVQVSLKEEGIAFLVKTDKGWEPADEEIKKQLTDEVNKKIQEELDKRSRI